MPNQQSTDTNMPKYVTGRWYISDSHFLCFQDFGAVTPRVISPLNFMPFDLVRQIRDADGIEAFVRRLQSEHEQEKRDLLAYAQAEEDATYLNGLRATPADCLAFWERLRTAFPDIYEHQHTQWGNPNTSRAMDAAMDDVFERLVNLRTAALAKANGEIRPEKEGGA